MRELTDAEIEAMSSDEKAEYARRRAAAKYHNPDLDREGDGGGGKTVVWAVAIVAAVLATVAVGWAWQNQTAAQVDREMDRLQAENQTQFRQPQRMNAPATFRMPGSR